MCTQPPETCQWSRAHHERFQLRLLLLHLRARRLQLRLGASELCLGSSGGVRRLLPRRLGGRCARRCPLLGLYQGVQARLQGSLPNSGRASRLDLKGLHAAFVSEHIARLDGKTNDCNRTAANKHTRELKQACTMTPKQLSRHEEGPKGPPGGN